MHILPSRASVAEVIDVHVIMWFTEKNLNKHYHHHHHFLYHWSCSRHQFNTFDLTFLLTVKNTMISNTKTITMKKKLQFYYQ